MKALIVGSVAGLAVYFLVAILRAALGEPAPRCTEEPGAPAVMIWQAVER